LVAVFMFGRLCRCSVITAAKGSGMGTGCWGLGSAGRKINGYGRRASVGLLVVAPGLGASSVLFAGSDGGGLVVL
jgi:hypothetical protein